MEAEKKITLKELLSPMWYVRQTMGWMWESYALILVAAIGNLYITFGMGHLVTWISYVTYIASLLSIWCVGGIMNTSPVNGVGGIASAVLYIIVAIHSHNPADAILQATYILLLDIPVLTMPSWSTNVAKKVRFIHETGIRGEKHRPKFWYTLLTAVFVVAFVGAYLFEVYVSKSPRPLVDSLVLGSGLTGAILTTMRFSESTIMWVVQGALQIILWGTTAMMGDANWVLFFTYSLFMVNDLLGIFKSKWFHHKAETIEAQELAK